VKKSISEIRNEKGITQSCIAEKLGIPVSTYNMYEKGRRKVPEKIATGIAQLLGIGRDDIFLPVTFAVSKTVQSCSRSSCLSIVKKKIVNINVIMQKIGNVNIEIDLT